MVKEELNIIPLEKWCNNQEKIAKKEFIKDSGRMIFSYFFVAWFLTIPFVFMMFSHYNVPTDTLKNNLISNITFAANSTLTIFVSPYRGISNFFGYLAAIFFILGVISLIYDTISYIIFKNKLKGGQKW